MGRIKTALIKRVSKKLVATFRDRLSGEVEHNKKIVAEVTIIHSKKLKNVIAGYATRLMKQHEEI